MPSHEKDIEMHCHYCITILHKVIAWTTSLINHWYDSETCEWIAPALKINVLIFIVSMPQLDFSANSRRPLSGNHIT